MAKIVVRRSGISGRLWSLLCVAWASLPPLGAGPLFPVRLHELSAGLISSIRLIDLDADGVDDLVGTNWRGLVFLHGNGDATFGAEQVAPAGNPDGTYLLQESLAEGDFNGDGFPDVAVAASTQTPALKILVYIGTGDGSFRPPAATVVGVRPYGMTAADLDGDGFEDLAIAAPDDNEVLILPGIGDGMFGPPSSLSALAPEQVFAGDVDGRQGAELVVLERPTFDCDPTGCVTFPGGVEVFARTAGGAFQAESRVEINEVSGSFAVDDVTGDGVPDAVVARRFRSVAVLPGGRDGRFGPPATFDTGMSPSDVVVADVDRDGARDVVVANRDSSDLSILRGDGRGGFSPEVRYVAALEPSSVATGDLNADGFPDLVVASGRSSTYAVLVGRGDGTFPSPVRIGIGGRPSSMAIGDLDDDGFTDLVLGSGGWPSPTSISTLLGEGDLAFAEAFRLPRPVLPADLILHDTDGDGREDLLVRESGTLDGALLVLRGKSDGSFEQLQRIEAGGNVTSFAAADFDGDGRDDVAAVLQPCPALPCLVEPQVRLFPGRDDGGFASGILLPIPQRPAILATSDIDSDGDADLVLADPDAGEVTAHLGDGAGRFDSSHSFPLEGIVTSILLEDLNDDGASDLALTRLTVSGDGGLTYIGRGDGTFVLSGSHSTASFPSSLRAGDFDADGMVDLALVDAGNVLILLGRGNGTFDRRESYAVGGRAERVEAGDLDGDRRLDLIVTYAADFRRRLIPINWDTFNYNGVSLVPNEGPYPLVRIEVDVNPGGVRSQVNRRSRGVTKVALISSPDLDATTIDPATIRLAGAAVRPAGGSGRPICRAGDVNRDGLADVICSVGTREMALSPGESELVLSARTIYGVPVEGRDTVQVLP